MNFIGIDVHKERLTVASINENLGINFIENIHPDKIAAYLNAPMAELVGVDAPCRLNLGLMNTETYRKTLSSNLKGHYNKKVSEYELSWRGINPFPTPGSMDEICGWKEWMHTGFDLFTKLKELGYKELTVNTPKDQSAHTCIEVFPHACFAVLLGHLPSKKDTEVGMAERIGVLGKAGFQNVPSLLDGFRKHEKTDRLDALVAAYTAYLCFYQQALLVGDVKEGQIALPTTELKDSYKRLPKVKLL